MIYLAQYDSPLGRLMITSDEISLLSLRFSEKSIGSMESTPSILDETCRWLDSYFNGKVPDFNLSVAPSGTPFQQRVWAELMTIPYGETVSYGDIARRINCRSAQAVGGAVGRNPVAIVVPCHRVVGADGSLTGYAYGLERKRQLLMLEKNGIRVL